ncbi:MAG: hypothetical protein R3261_12300, partial [Alphaproteobacteria bacterium]|nr:hypothetical protein [Alphaproteobacteria bacterium]
MTVGLFIPDFSDILRPFTFVFLFVVMLCSLCRIRIPTEEVHYAINKRDISQVIFWQIIVTPFLVWIACQFFEVSTSLTIALVACSCAGPVFSTPTYARLSGLNDQFTTANVVISNFCMPAALLIAGMLYLDTLPHIELEEFIYRVG